MIKLLKDGKTYKNFRTKSSLFKQLFIICKNLNLLSFTTLEDLFKQYTFNELSFLMRKNEILLDANVLFREEGFEKIQFVKLPSGDKDVWVQTDFKKFNILIFIPYLEKLLKEHGYFVVFKNNNQINKKTKLKK